ncbi:MAG: glycosyltransferase family 4 protein [Anaerolineaceae bacterium]
MNNRIPVLHVINECDDGSISRIVERIMRFSDDPTFKWYVCAVRGLQGFEKAFEALGAQVIDGTSGKGWPESTTRILHGIIERNQIRIIHSHTPRTILAAWLALRAVDHHLSTPPVHLATKHLLTTPLDRRMGHFYTLYDRLTLYPPDHIVTVSDRMAVQVQNQPGISPLKVTAIPNSIPVEDFHRPDLRDFYRQKWNFSAEDIVIGFTGRIQKVKNLDILIRAFALLSPDYPHLRLALAGSGDLQSELEALSKSLGVADRITWTGFVNDIPGFLSSMDIYIQPSINEGLSLSILEAMAAGKPVIATRVGSAEDVIDNENTGLVIQPRSEEAIVNSVKILLDNPDLRQRLAQNAKNTVFEKYNLQKMVDSYIKLYHELSESRGD